MRKLLVSLLMGLVLTSCEFGKEEQYDPMQDESVKSLHFQNLNGWSDVLVSKDGPMYFIDQNSYTGEMNTLFSVVETDESKLTPGYIRFGENNIPSYIEINNTRLYVTNVNNETISFILLYTVDGVEYVYTVSDYAHDLNLSSGDTRGFAADNYVALHNSIAIGQLVVGAVEVGAGVLMIAGGVATVNPLIITAGAISLAGGIMTIGSGYENITSDPYYTAPEPGYVETILFEVGQNTFEKIDEKYFKNFMKDHPILDKVGWGTFLAELSLDALNQLLENSDDVELLKAYYNYQVITGRSENVLSTVATLWGYVSPTEDLPNGAQSEVEYGINVCAAGSHSPLFKYEVTGGPGAVFKHTFKDLQPDTEYSYYTYFYDIINNIVLYGPINNFKTSNEEAYIEDVEIIDTPYHEDGNIYFSIKVHARYDYTEENTPKSWGIIAYHKGEELGYVAYDISGGTSKKFRLNFTEDNLNVNNSAYIAKVEDCSFATYIEYQDETCHYSKDYYPVDGLVYDKKPSYEFNSIGSASVSIIGIDENNKIEYNASIPYSYTIDGTFWIEYTQSITVAENWVNSETGTKEGNPWTPRLDRTYNSEWTLHYWSTTNMSHINYERITDKSGRYIYSKNSVVWGGTPEAPYGTIGGVPATRTASNIVGTQNSYAAGGSCNVIQKETKIKLSDTHNSKYRVIEEIKCPNGSVIEILE